MISNSGSALYEYQIKVILSTTTFDYSKANNDGSDIRFFDTVEMNDLGMWCETWDNAGDSIFWVKVTTIAGSGDTGIYMYYGNASTGSISNALAVFDLYDNFDDSSVCLAAVK